VKLRLFSILFFICLTCFAQKEANIWYFGQNAGLDFNSGTPVPLSDSSLNTFEGCATISNAIGELLFYTDGITVYNRTHNIMSNGTGLNGDPSSTHSAIIVPRPDHPDIYYIFTVDDSAGPNGLQYSEVDMSLDNGLGAITVNKNIVLETPTLEKITAVISSVANEYWVVSHRYGNNEFIAYNVSNSGLNTTPVVSATGSAVDTDPNNSIGQIKISPNGLRLAMANWPIREVQLFDFDAATGQVSNAITIVDPTVSTSPPIYGIEFSSNSDVLYGSAFTGHVYQYNLQAGSPLDIANSQLQLSTSVEGYGSMQLATDGKIYVSKSGPTLDVINNPSVVGVGCDFLADELSLGGGTAALGLPPFIQTFLIPTIQFQGVCLGDVTNFFINDAVDSASWDFGDPASGANNTSTDIAPTHIFTAPGIYDVTVQVVSGTQMGTLTITIEIYDLPTIVQRPADVAACDLDNNGIETFDFTPQIAQIIGSQDPTIFEVSFAIDANFNIPIPDPTNYTNTDPDETIYYRIINRNNTQCGSIDFFQLNVSNGINVPANISNYELCDDDTDGDDTNGFVDSFLLSTKDSEVLGSLNPADYEVNYFLTEDDANDNVNALDKTIPYQNATANSQTIYVRVNDLVSSACVNTDLEFDLVVNSLPTVTPLVELRQCDDDTDGFSLFNLHQASEEISANFTNETFTFYPSLIDAQNDTNPILNPTAYENQTVTTDRVWARTFSEGNCFRISEVDIIVSTTSIPSTFQPSFTECDDFLDINGDDTVDNDNTDGITAFNFSSVTTDVEALFPPSQQLVIAYYRNEADALAEENAIADPSNYRNIGYPNTQQIHIRVDSQLDNDCLGLGPYLTLNVEAVPNAEPVNDLELCDDLVDGDGFNGIVQNFDLDSQTAGILGSQNPTNFTVTYHLSYDDALNGDNAITNTSAYENSVPNQQTIFVRIVNNTTGCFSNQTSFDLIVNPLPIANTVQNLEVCDDNSDGSAQNGFAQTFDLESQTADILGGQDPTQFSVTYHVSLSDAEQGILPLGSPFSNSIPYSQTIYVRVFNPTSGCANGITSFDAIVNPEPSYENISNLSFCDDDTDGDDTNGIVQNIDLDDQIADILGTSQLPDDFTVTFHTSQANATSGDNPLSSPFTNTIPFQQTIYTRVQNNATGCVNDDFTFDIIVNPLPEFSVTTPQIICLNLVPLTIGIENPSAIYDYVWMDPTGNTLVGPNIDINNGGTYTVTATTTGGTSCSRTREIIVNESNIATITLNDVTIIDDSDNNSITIDPTNLGIGDYEYALIDEDDVQTLFQDDPLFENLEGGFYRILVRDKNGCGVSQLEVPVIAFPKFFTPNNDGVNDTWSVKGVNSRFNPGSEIYIFNRYGKLVAKLDIDEPGWDGMYNSQLLPSNDYWFSIKIVEVDGTVRERKGNFSLLRK